MINNCLNCKKAISRYATRCRSCASKENLKNKSLKGKNNPNWKGGIYLKDYFCKDCGKKLGKHALYKCGRCHSCDTKRRVLGKDNPMYIDGRTPLNKAIRRLIEYSIWKREIFERDNYTCKDCNTLGGVLNAHHDKKSFAQLLNEFLQEYNQFSPIEDKEILVRLSITWKPFWEIGNGKTLCKECHQNKAKKNDTQIITT